MESTVEQAHHALDAAAAEADLDWDPAAPTDKRAKFPDRNSPPGFYVRPDTEGL